MIFYVANAASRFRNAASAISKKSVTMSDSSDTKNPSILPYQQVVFDRLCAVGRACLCVDRSKIKHLKLRANFLLIGPTGSGKTFLARALADVMNVPFIAISVSDWLLLGSSNKGGACTWPVIFKFLQDNRQRQGVIIFLDEIDKISHDSNWNAFLRTEIFNLLDSRVPVGINDCDHDLVDEVVVEEVESMLKYRTMIVAGAAFQCVWDSQSTPSMGFQPSIDKPATPELPDLAKYLQRELLNRFSSEMFILPQLKKEDYRIMIETMADKVPDMWRAKFLELGMERLDQAVDHQKGARYAEEILLSAIVAERGCMADFVPDSPQIDEGVDEDELDDRLMVF